MLSDNTLHCAMSILPNGYLRNKSTIIIIVIINSCISYINTLHRTSIPYIIHQYLYMIHQYLYKSVFFYFHIFQTYSRFSFSPSPNAPARGSRTVYLSMPRKVKAR